MVRYCKICKLSKDNDAGSTLFQVPQVEKKRSQWRKACGVFLTKCCLVCEKHFHPSDFVTRGNQTRLRVDAIPTEFPYVDPQSKSNAEDTTLADPTPTTPAIKTEPPELVLVNQTESKGPGKDSEPWLDVNIKVEPIEVPEPLILIHEARFDEENSNATTSVPEKPVSAPETVTETEKEKDNSKKRICAQIEATEDEGRETFKIKCNYCDFKCQISYWPYFVDHMKADHEQQNPVEKTPTPKPQQQTVLIDQEGDNSSQEESVTNEPVDEEQSDNSSESSEDEEEEIKKNDEDYEPKAKKTKQSKEKDVTNRKNDSNKKTPKENLIFFDHPEEQCVMDYLELLKSNAILWHRRQSIMKRFDEALTKITKEFNEKWSKYQMTDEQSRTSINRIKDLYQRVSDPTHKRHIKNSTHQKKYPKYFEICAEIEENSKKLTNACDNCRAFFFTEIDLQIHKFKVHRIGELPFKCSRCKYGFSKADKLAEHEQKHHRLKAFTCEVCKKGFFDESKLHAHEAIHTNDYKPVCEVCGEMFSTYSKYRRHKLHHEPPKEKCDICGKLYYEKWNLSEHVKSHLNERSYQCDICGKSFNHQNDVTIHKRGVHNVKPQPRKYVWVNKYPVEYEDDEHGFSN